MSDDRDAEAAMRERLNQLGVLFLQRSTREMDSLRELLAQLRRGDATVLEQIRHLVHKMHGTGATLGFESISERAGEIELCRSMPGCWRVWRMAWPCSGKK